MKGLIIRAPWIDYILSGKKDWEIRGRKTNIRGKIYLIQKGTGLIVGEIELVDCKLITHEEFQANVEHHRVDDPSQLHYKKTYAWVLENPIKYDEVRPYNHPKGAVIWVNL